ncbi:hypothetical protein PG993_008056 [Apiospora rasikravindrae]|uniref:Uncharacterized protein n=1 Tax=Apiospora rasikravindrae TaxID=990691 RepID=A0ABR1SZA0_9PEZI
MTPTYTHKRKRTGQNEAPVNGPLRNRRKVDDTREASTTEEAALRTMTQPHRPASDALTPILSDMDRRHNTRRSVLAKIAHALDRTSTGERPGPCGASCGPHAQLG